MQYEIEVAGIEDPYRNAEANGWDIFDARKLNDDWELETDVVVVGTGSGGGTAAEVLSEAGLRVVMLEEGMLKSSDRFNMQEREAITDLYRDAGLQATKGEGIYVFQGRNVGGGTTVNWCSSFRTPQYTLRFWERNFGLKGCSEDDLAPYFEHAERQFNITEWPAPPNLNNEILKRGAEKLGYSWGTIPRNVDGCWDLGYCGQGCPVDAKKSMLVTTIPNALRNGSKLIYRATVNALLREGDRVVGVKGRAQKRGGGQGTGKKITVRAKHVVLAAGAIHTPGILLRSDAPDPYDRIGKRTFLHPVINSYAQFKEQIDPYYGAPQSIYSDHFAWNGGDEKRIGYKLEVMPLLPGTYATLQGGHGAQLGDAMKKLPNTHVMMALLRDGFHDESRGGSVALSERGRAVLDYPLTAYLSDGVRRAFETMTEIQFAAGAAAVRVGHRDSVWQKSFADVKESISRLSLELGKTSISSAHVMGGCAMGEDEKLCVTDSRGRFRYLENLSIFDGSLFPTSLGVNPQLSIFGFARKFAMGLVNDLEI